MSVGRPSIFSEAVADAICEWLLEGKSLRWICGQDDMPSRATVLRWQGSNPDFEAKCARAREMQADLMDDLILDTAENCTAETAQADRVKIAAYQWRAEKLKPKKYGTRSQVELSGPDGAPVQVQRIERVIVDAANPNSEGVLAVAKPSAL